MGARKEGGREGRREEERSNEELHAFSKVTHCITAHRGSWHIWCDILMKSLSISLSYPKNWISDALELFHQATQQRQYNRGDCSIYT